MVNEAQVKTSQGAATGPAGQVVAAYEDGDKGAGVVIGAIPVVTVGDDAPRVLENAGIVGEGPDVVEFDPGYFDRAIRQVRDPASGARRAAARNVDRFPS